MNKEEIDKILSRLERIDHKEYSCSFEFADSGSFKEICMCFDERKKLANYIKELQQENRQLKELFNNGGYCKLKKKCDDGLCDCTNEEYNSMCENNMILSLRIDKAIEYIKQFPSLRYSSVDTTVDGKRLNGKLIPTDDLLEILKGDRNE